MVVGGGVLSDYFVSTQLQLLLFCFWGCGCCWAVTIIEALVQVATVFRDFRWARANFGLYER